MFFTTKGDNRVWCYDTKTSEINIIYDFEKSDNAILSGVDNLTITPAGDVLVAEDGGNMQLIGITLNQNLIPIAQVVGMIVPRFVVQHSILATTDSILALKEARLALVRMA